jgi:hypothetical protein
VRGSFWHVSLATCWSMVALVLTLLVSHHALAEPKSAAERERAARAYDDGVTAFERADYHLAAERFLEADALVASNDALANALSAAQKAGDQALLERSAARALTREKEEPELAKTARRLLAESKRATAAPQATKPPAAAAHEAQQPSAGPQRETRSLSAPAAVVKNDVPVSADRHRAGPEKPWPRALFYAGAVGTAVFGGLAIWSGVDTLDARARLPGTRDDNESVRARALRTDALLAGTFVLAAATAYVGLAKIDWSRTSEPVALGGELALHGGVITARGQW